MVSQSLLAYLCSITHASIDVLEKFNAPAASSSSSKPAVTNTTVPKTNNEESINDEDFAKQFAAEMEAFMQELVNPDGKSEPLDPKVADQAEALRKTWEQLLVDDLEGNDEKDDESTSSELSGSKPKAEAASRPSTSQAEDEFQKAVRQAMEKIKESDDSNKAC